MKQAAVSWVRIGAPGIAMVFGAASCMVAGQVCAQDTARSTIQGSTQHSGGGLDEVLPVVAAQPRVEVTPYVWVPTISGRLSTGPLELPLTVVPSELAEGVDAGILGHIRINDGNRFAYGEAILMDFSDDRFSPFLNQAVVSKVIFVELGAGYSQKIKFGDSEARISPYIGMQSLYIDANVSGSLANIETGGSWVNPAAGVIVEVPLADALSLSAKLDASGFGMGRTDYRSYTAALNYRFANGLDVIGGYRKSEGKFGSNGNSLAMDLVGAGPIFAMRYSFGK